MKTPDKWVALKMGGVIKIFGMWYGGYLNGDSWQLNSGVVAVEDKGEYYLFEGESGSIYKCYKSLYGCNTFGAATLQSWKGSGAEFEVLDDKYDFLKHD